MKFLIATAALIALTSATTLEQTASHELAQITVSKTMLVQKKGGKKCDGKDCDDCDGEDCDDGDCKCKIMAKAKGKYMKMMKKMDKKEEKMEEKIAKMKEKAGDNDKKMAKAEKKAAKMNEKFTAKKDKEMTKFRAWAAKNKVCMLKLMMMMEDDEE